MRIGLVFAFDLLLNDQGANMGKKDRLEQSANDLIVRCRKPGVDDELFVQSMTSSDWMVFCPERKRRGGEIEKWHFE